MAIEPVDRPPVERLTLGVLGVEKLDGKTGTGHFAVTESDSDLPKKASADKLSAHPDTGMHQTTRDPADQTGPLLWADAHTAQDFRKLMDRVSDAAPVRKLGSEAENENGNVRSNLCEGQVNWARIAAQGGDSAVLEAAQQIIRQTEPLLSSI
jgi:hypothetical protein